MSTPKINFFIQAVSRGIFTGRCPGHPGVLRTIVRVSSPGTGFRRGAGKSPGKIRGTSRCAQRVMTPNPNNCSRSRRSRSCNPESRWYNNPNNLSVYPEARAGNPEVRSRTPNIPNISRWAGGCPTPPNNPSIPLGFRYLLLLGFVRLLWEFLLV